VASGPAWSSSSVSVGSCWSLVSLFPVVRTRPPSSWTVETDSFGEAVSGCSPSRAAERAVMQGRDAVLTRRAPSTPDDKGPRSPGARPILRGERSAQRGAGGEYRCYANGVFGAVASGDNGPLPCLSTSRIVPGRSTQGASLISAWP
jgi:hypothetical protein